MKADTAFIIKRSIFFNVKALFTEALLLTPIVHFLTWIGVTVHWGLHSNDCLLGSTYWIVVHTDNSRLEYNDNYIVIIVWDVDQPESHNLHTTPGARWPTDWPIIRTRPSLSLANADDKTCS